MKDKLREEGVKMYERIASEFMSEDYCHNELNIVFNDCLSVKSF